VKLSQQLRKGVIAPDRKEVAVRIARPSLSGILCGRTGWATYRNSGESNGLAPY